MKFLVVSLVLVFSLTTQISFAGSSKNSPIKYEKMSKRSIASGSINSGNYSCSMISNYRLVPTWLNDNCKNSPDFRVTMYADQFFTCCKR